MSSSKLNQGLTHPWHIFMLEAEVLSMSYTLAILYIYILCIYIYIYMYYTCITFGEFTLGEFPPKLSTWVCCSQNPGFTFLIVIYIVFSEVYEANPAKQIKLSKKENSKKSSPNMYIYIPSSPICYLLKGLSKCLWLQGTDWDSADKSAQWPPQRLEPAVTMEFPHQPIGMRMLD